MTTTDDLAAVVRDEAERCGVDVSELARVLLGWTAEELEEAERLLRHHQMLFRLRRRTTAMLGATSEIRWFDEDCDVQEISARFLDDASPPAATGGDE